MKNKIISIFSVIIVVLCANVQAQVTVHVNSGNPRFPFPQFLSYSYGDSHSLDNLGTQNPEGVVHAEMEKSIREAYQIFANEFKYTGDELNGVKYIRGNLGMPYDGTEGTGYSLLAAAIMGDKTTYDGLWLRTHDTFRGKTKRYLDCTDNQPNYAYGLFPLAEVGGNTAADGDVDIALATYIAWRQWGDFMGINDACGNPISYKKEMIEVIRGLVALSTRFPTENPKRCNSGDIGLDGYMKNGDTWTEETTWASDNKQDIDGDGALEYPEYGGPQRLHVDYSAPAYFKEFYDLLKVLEDSETGSSDWEREQFLRATASCDWFVGNWIAQSAQNIPFGGWAAVNGNNCTWTTFQQGEDFRAPWRTILNYVWHGNPDYTWNPSTHSVTNTGNTYEYDGAVRYTKYMNNPQAWNNTCTEMGGGPEVSYKGPLTLQWDISPSGEGAGTFTLNWIPACGTPAAVAAQDLDLLGLLYRQCEIEWDVATAGDGYLSSKPVYFHGWFRLLGMLIATGNHLAPSQMAEAKPNLKIYRSIQDSLSYAYTGDSFTYYLDYRNYGSVDAEGAKIVEHVPEDFLFAGAANGGVYDDLTHTVTWNIGTVPGFKTGHLEETMGRVSYTVKVGPNASGRYCTTAEISCDNGLGWTSNEYPNFVTATMQRNCVDVIKRSLVIEKKANLEEINPGNVVTYTINFENSSEAGWLDGGRPRVGIAFANTVDGSQNWLKFRLYNDAIEPYINYGNYRISYYLYDSNMKCLAGDDGCATGWAWSTAIYEGKRTDADKVTVSHETVVEGEDDYGKWNQRMMIRFAPLLVTTTAHLSNYYGMGARIHRGGTEPLRVAGYLYPSNYAATNYTDDWSWDAGATDSDGGLYYPVTPSWQEIDPSTGKSIEKTINEYIPSVCESPNHTVSNILVEEYDGYAWRRVLGTGPMAGRDASNVVVCDTLPKGLNFVAFQNTCPLSAYGASWTTKKTADGRDIVTWSIPTMQIKQKGSIIYTATATFPSGSTCQTDNEDIDNVAWIYADLNSPIGDTATITVTCAKVPTPIEPTTLSKIPSAETVAVGDEVTYTLEYEQTHGSIFENVGANANNWTTSSASVSGGTVTLNGYASANARYKYSKSLNSYVSFDANFGTYSSTNIYFRDDLVVTIRTEYATIKVSCTDGGTNKNSAEINSGGATAMSLIFDVTDDVLRMWVNKDTTNSADYTVEGVSKTAGYFGFSNTEAGCSYSNIYVHSDYAYNLSIVDEMPSDLTYVSSDNGGVYVDGEVTWTFEQGIDNPIPPGKFYSVSVTAMVNTCDEKIINEAHVNLLGYTEEDIRAQAVVECANNTPDPPIVEDVTYCQGDEAIVLTAEGEDLQWYDVDKKKIASAPTPSTESATTLTYYVTQTIDGVESAKVPVSVVVNPKPSKPTISTNSPVCVGEELIITTLSMKDATYEWSGPNGFTSDEVENTILAASVDNAGEYTVVVTSEFQCESDPASADIVVNPLPNTPEAKTSLLYCKGQEAEELTAVGTDIQWYSVADGGTALEDVPIPTTTIVRDVNYYVTQTVDGCESERLEIQVSTVDKPEAPTITNNGPLCEGSTLELGVDVDGTYMWEGPNGFTSDEQNPTIADVTSGDAGEYSLVVTVGTCQSDKATTDIVVNSIPKTPVPVNNGPKCEGEDVTLTVSAVADATYAWTGPNEFTAATQVAVATEPGEYQLVVTVENCESEAGKTTVVIYDEPSKPIVKDVQYCQGESVTEALTAEGTDLKWYTSATASTSLSASPKPSTSIVGSVSYFVSQLVNNCESKRAELVVKTLEPPTPPTVSSNSPLCAGETVMLGTESEGTYHWSGPQGFTSDEQNPEIVSSTDAAGEYSVIVTVGNCTSEPGKTTVVVNPVPIVTIESVANVCVDGSDVALKVTAIPTGGVGEFEGPGVTGSVFSPSVAGVGTHEISYTYEVNGCSTKETIQVVVQEKPEVSFELPAIACASGETITLTGNQVGGTFTAIPNVSLTSGFNPATATVEQEYTITYEYSDGICSNSVSKPITVYDPEKPVGTDVAIVYTKVTSGNVPPLSATGVNQVWYSDAALTQQVALGDSYTPDETDVIEGGEGKVGTYTYYVVSTESGCVSEATSVRLDISSCAAEAPTKSAASVSVCYGVTDEDERRISVITAASGNVRWYDSDNTLLQDSESLTYLPTQTEVGTTTFYVSTYDTEAHCESAKTSILYSIKQLPTVSFNLSETVCAGANEIDFATLKSQPTGVVYEHPNESVVESFNPTTAGTYSFRYSYTDANNCTNSVEKQIEVYALPDITINTVPNICEYDEEFDLSTYAAPTGGTFSGAGVSQGKMFNPAAVTAGTTSTVIYSYTDVHSCTNTRDVSVTVNARPDVSFSNVPSLCVGEAPVDLLQYVTDKTGSFSGEHISDAQFNPEENGDFTISYTIDAEGCSTTIEKSIVVNDLPSLLLETNDVLCVNTGDVVPVLSPTGGTFTIDGEDAAAINTNTLLVGTHILEYVYTDQATKCSNAISESIELRKIETPTVEDKTIVVGSDDLSITAEGNGGMFVWTDENGIKTTGASISHSNSSNAGEWKYCVTETDGTCTSESACMTFTVMWCPTPAPQVTVADTVYVNESVADILMTEVCASEDIPTFFVQGIDGSILKWYGKNGLLSTSTPEAFMDASVKGNAGTYSWSVTQTTTGENGCEGLPTSVAVVVHPNPQISIDNETLHFCDYDDNVQIKVSSDVAEGEYSYSGEAVEDGYFDPSKAQTIGSAIPISVTFTAAETGCSVTESSRFYVHHVEPLTVTSPITQLESDYETVLEVTPDGSNKVVWYDVCGENRSQLYIGNPYRTGLVGMQSEDYGVTQRDRYGCESECKTIQVDRIKCPTPAPTVILESESICETDDVPTFIVQGKENATFTWYADGEVISHDAEFVPSFVQGNPNTYVWSVTQTTIGRNGCEGVAAPVVFVVHPSPVIEVVIDDVICKNGGVKIPESNLDGTSFAFNGSKVTQIDPTHYENGFYKLYYNYYDPETGCHAVDPSMSCYEEDCLYKTIEIREIPQVVVDNATNLVISDSFPISITSGNGGSYTWYDSTNSVIGTSETINHPYGAKVGTWEYCVTESDGVCTSDPACMTYTLIDCPVPAPTIIEQTVIGCTNEELKPMQAEHQEYMVRWYKASDMSTILWTGFDYVPDDITVAGDYKYYAAQFDGTCEGLPTLVTYSLKTTPMPVVTGNQVICENEELELVADDNVYWYTTDPQTSEADQYSDLFTVSYPNAGEYSVYSIRKDEYCSSNPQETSVEVHSIPSSPLVTTNNVCEGTDVVYKADGTDISWYVGGYEIATGEEYVISNMYAGEISVQAAQTVDGCTSPLTEEVVAIVYPIPQKPSAVNYTICEDDDIQPVGVRAYAETVTWYSDEELATIVATGMSYVPKTKETQTFYVVQTENNCTSEPVEVTFKVQQNPEPVRFKQTTDIVSCEGTPVVIVSETSNTVYWYDDPNGFPIYTGRVYTVTNTEEGSYVYYARQKDAYGCLSELSAKKVILKPAPTKATVVQEDTVCIYDKQGTLIAVRNNEDETISWIAPNGSTLGIGDTLNVSSDLITDAGVFWFRARTTNSTCSYETRKETPLKFVVLPQPESPTLNKESFCYTGEPVRLSAEGENILWYSEDGNLIPGCPYKNECPTQYVDAGVYNIYMTQMVNGCVSDTLLNQVIVSALPSPYITGKSELCANANEVYVVTKTDNSNFIDWKVTGNRVTYELSTYNTGFVRSIDWTTPGIDTIYVTEKNQYGCAGSTEFIVEVVPVPDAQFITESLGQEGVVTFTNTSEPQVLQEGDFNKEYHVDYYWDFGRNVDTVLVIENDKVFERLYKYGDHMAEMTAVNEFGCSAKYEVGFFVDVEHRLYVPTAFAPLNPSHEIRVFKPKGVNCKTFEIWVYDAWNNLVYYSSGVDELGAPIASWDGKVNGQYMQAGTYRYKILATFEDHEEENLRITQQAKPIYGSVVLMR